MQQQTIKKKNTANGYSRTMLTPKSTSKSSSQNASAKSAGMLKEITLLPWPITFKVLLRFSSIVCPKTTQPGRSHRQKVSCKLLVSIQRDPTSLLRLTCKFSSTIYRSRASSLSISLVANGFLQSMFILKVITSSLELTTRKSSGSI